MADGRRPISVDLLPEVCSDDFEKVLFRTAFVLAFGSITVK